MNKKSGAENLVLRFNPEIFSDTERHLTIVDNEI